MRNETAFKYFPMDFLYTSSLDDFMPLLSAIHEYLASLFNGSYSQKRKTHFLDMLTQDFSNKVFQILSAMNVLQLSFVDFDIETETGIIFFSSTFFRPG
jgi:hypothetical protein